MVYPITTRRVRKPLIRKSSMKKYCVKSQEVSRQEMNSSTESIFGFLG